MYSVPAKTTPDPTGAAPARPLAEFPGTLGLLLSWILLFCQMSQMPSPSGPGAPPGHCPFWGGGWSSLFSESWVGPVLLWSNSEFSIVRLPPALVPEKPSELYCARMRFSTALQLGHAPT